MFLYRISRLRIAFLALGTVLGYGFGIHAMHHSASHREAFERHVAEVCVGAANSLKGDKTAPKTGDSPAGEPTAP
ncbi:MAG TPA: hypothetical protein VGL13_12420 [Polyangiaceae bacterium]|jgi:hypothetical protein